MFSNWHLTRIVNNYCPTDGQTQSGESRILDLCFKMRLLELCFNLGALDLCFKIIGTVIATNSIHLENIYILPIFGTLLTVGLSVVF